MFISTVTQMFQQRLFANNYSLGLNLQVKCLIIVCTYCAHNYCVYTIMCTVFDMHMPPVQSFCICLFLQKPMHAVVWTLVCFSTCVCFAYCRSTSFTQGEVSSTYLLCKRITTNSEKWGIRHLPIFCQLVQLK